MNRTLWSFIAAGTAAAALAAAAHAQAIRPVPTPMPAAETGITAHGHAEIKAKPDIALVTVSVITEDRKQAVAADENAGRTRQVMAALKAAGVAAKDIQTLSYSVQPQYNYNVQPPTLTGYQARNTIQVKIRDLGKAGVVMDSATEAGASEVSGLNFDVEDHEKVEGDALAAAVRNARQKADLMAHTAGVSLGRLLGLSEGNAPIIQPVYTMRAMKADAAMSEPTPVSPGEITVTADVTVAYGINLAE